MLQAPQLETLDVKHRRQNAKSVYTTKVVRRDKTSYSTRRRQSNPPRPHITCKPYPNPPTPILLHLLSSHHHPQPPIRF